MSNTEVPSRWVPLARAEELEAIGLLKIVERTVVPPRFAIVDWLEEPLAEDAPVEGA